MAGDTWDAVCSVPKAEASKPNCSIVHHCIIFLTSPLHTFRSCFFTASPNIKDGESWNGRRTSFWPFSSYRQRFFFTIFFLLPPSTNVPSTLRIFLGPSLLNGIQHLIMAWASSPFNTDVAKPLTTWTVPWGSRMLRWAAGRMDGCDEKIETCRNCYLIFRFPPAIRSDKKVGKTTPHLQAANKAGISLCC